MPTITPAVLAGERAAATHPLSEPYALRPGVLATLWQQSLRHMRPMRPRKRARWTMSTP